MRAKDITADSNDDLRRVTIGTPIDEKVVLQIIKDGLQRADSARADIGEDEEESPMLDPAEVRICLWRHL